MPIKTSERNIVLALICFVTGIIILINTTLFAAPVHISEKGILYGIAAAIAIAYSVRLFKRAVVKV